MNRRNHGIEAKHRMRFTGESRAQARNAIKVLDANQRLIPDAVRIEQQRAESALLNRLLYGARSLLPVHLSPWFPLAVEAVHPTADALLVIVPRVAADFFGRALAMQGIPGNARPAADEVSLSRRHASMLLLTTPGGPGGTVNLKCLWTSLRSAIDADPHVSTAASDHLRFDAGASLRLEPTEHAILSSLLRRAALFTRSDALTWLLDWHAWLIAGRRGAGPRLPGALAADLEDEVFGLYPPLLGRLGVVERQRQPESRHAWPAENQEVEPSTASAEKPTVRADFDMAPSTSTTTDQVAGNDPDEWSTPTSSGYNTLAVTVLQLAPEHALDHELYAMRFPAAWKNSLLSLARVASRTRVTHLSITSLNDAITAVLPDCIVAANRFDGNDEAEHDWLFAYRPVAPARILELVDAWIRAQNGSQEHTDRALAQVRAADLTWSAVRIDTNTPPDRLFRLLPMMVANTLTRPDVAPSPGDLQFLRVPSAQGAELMSWPPRGVESQMPFSVTIRISLHTRPFDSHPVIHLAFGTRRWMPVRGWLSPNQIYPVYLRSEPNASLPPDDHHFRLAKIEYGPKPRRRGRDAWRPRWNDELTAVLNEAGQLGALPDAGHIVEKPMEGLSPNGDAAALPYRWGMLPWIKARDGLSVTDREALLSWAANELAPDLVLNPLLLRVRRTIYKGLSRGTRSSIAPENLSDVVGSYLNIELVTQSVVTAQHALDRFTERLGMPLPRADELNATETRVSAAHITIGLRRITSVHTSAGADADNGPMQATIDAKIDAITSTLGRTAHPTITLIELDEADDTGKGSYDNDSPASALRQALLRTNRLSHVVTTPTVPNTLPRRQQDQNSPATHARLSNAVDDLLRQLGLRPTPLPAPTRGTVTRPPALVGIWMMRPGPRTANHPQHAMPLAIRTTPDGRRIFIRTPTTNWQPLASALLDPSLQLTEYDHKITREDSIRFIRTTIDDVVSNNPDTLLLTHAQNLRRTWEFIRDDRIEHDTLQFDGDAGPTPICALPGLRHVRVRTSENDETPECYGIKGELIGQSSGLWMMHGPRLFASTGGKPATHMDALKGRSKIMTVSRHGVPTEPDPRAPVWNAEVVELLVAGLQDGDRPADWAALAHDLRNAEPYSPWTVSLPWPLHLAQRMESYLQAR
ncbi:pPIWI_RE module domain-containing protein [Actinosynnema sp. NPDC053489]|uniref:pPIWI_RE module domain-containing protein n=1 Tax=Actinosynnema sp. NPDC053489 TaxID=3363916 RepID=UPI0037CB6C54